MPQSLPALADLRTWFRTNFAARLPGFDQTLRRTVAGVIADGQGGGIFAGFRALAWLSRQVFIRTAEAPYLDRRLADYAIARVVGTVSSGNLVFSGSVDTPIPSGTVLAPPGSLVDSNGAALQFTTTVAGVIGGGGTVSLPVLASGPGSVGNLGAGTALTLVNAIAGVLPQAVVDVSGLAAGTDGENDDSLRARGLARIQQPPQGGAGADFWQWARATGIPTRAWVYPNNRGVGSCDVAFTIDSRPDPIPLTADLATVQAAIVAAAPTIGSFACFALIQDPLTINVHGLLPNTSATQAAVTAALVALCASVPPGGASFGDGVTVPLQTGALYPKQTPGTLYLEWINAAINSAATISSYDLTLPAADVTFATGHLPAVPTVTFT